MQKEPKIREYPTARGIAVGFFVAENNMPNPSNLIGVR